MLSRMSREEIYNNYGSCVLDAAELDHPEIMRAFLSRTSAYIPYLEDKNISVFSAEQIKSMTFSDEMALKETVMLANVETLAVLLKSSRLWKTETMLNILASKYLGDPACAQLLLKNLKFWKFDARVPVQPAILHGHPDVAIKIVESGWAEVTDVDVLLAARKGYNKFCALVLATCKIQIRNETFDEMLLLAVDQEDIGMVKSILNSPLLSKTVKMPLYDAQEKEDEQIFWLLFHHEMDRPFGL